MNEDNEIVDAKSGEIIPAGIDEQTNEPKRDVVVMKIDASKVGTLELSEQAFKALDEKLNPDDVKIRPDGFVYLQWTWFAKRLNDAFGRLGWGLLPQGSPAIRTVDKNTELVMWGFWLMVKGIPVSFAYGETSYRTNNKTMSHVDAVTGAKSIALARCCKELGIALELWDQQWIEWWKSEYAVYIKNPSGYPENIWVRKDDKRYKTSPKTSAQSKPKSETSKEPEAAVTAEEPKKEESGYTKAQILSNKEGQVQSLKDLTGKSSAEVCQFVGKLEERKKYSLFEISEMMNPKEKSDESVS